MVTFQVKDALAGTLPSLAVTVVANVPPVVGTPVTWPDEAPIASPGGKFVALNVSGSWSPSEAWIARSTGMPTTLDCAPGFTTTGAELTLIGVIGAARHCAPNASTKPPERP